MKKMRRILACVMCMVMLLGSGIASAEVVDGNYSATANGIGAVTVTIEVKEGKIVSADVDTSNETKNYGYELGEEFAKQIIDRQSAQVDAVSGSTITCNAVGVAAQSTFEQAGLASTSGNTMIPGIYVGTARGAKSDISMAVEVNENTIQNIWNIENDDTEIISEAAIQAVSKQILDEQTLAIDGYAGATLTSQGTIAAVGDALGQAEGNLVTWYQPKARELDPKESEEYDIVVVGGGTSGLMAALAAQTNSELGYAQSGLRVLVVERNGFAGGDLTFCGGYIAVYEGTPFNEATGVSTDYETVYKTFAYNRPARIPLLNEVVTRAVYNKSTTVINGLMDRGIYLSIEDARVNKINNPELEGGSMPYVMAVVANPETGVRSGDEGYDSTFGSPYFANSLSQIAKDAGVEIRLNTSCESLVIDDEGICTGILVADQDATYQINAKKVVLCTGYSNFDDETIDLFYPEQRGTIRFCSAGNLSDAPKWILNLGGEASVDASSNSILLGYDGVLGIDGEESFLYNKMNTVWVDVNGNRYFDESGPRSAAQMLTLDQPYSFMIFDDAHEGTKYFDSLSAQGLAWKADSLEGLAAEAGIAPQGLAATIAKYNADANADGDTVFNTSLDQMEAVEAGPFYAVRVRPVCTIANAGVFVDDDMTVLLSKGGVRIENLYAAGGAAGNNYINTPGLGVHVISALASGAYAGDCARDAILAK